MDKDSLLLLSPTDTTTYFESKKVVVENDLFVENIYNFENDMPTTMENNQLGKYTVKFIFVELMLYFAFYSVFHHPLSQQFVDLKVHSAPLIKKHPPILVKSINSSPSIPKHITYLLDEDKERRPSVLTFNSNNTSIFYDAKENLSVDDMQSHFDNTNVLRRPSAMSRISSAYTNKTAAITIDQIDLDKCQYIHEGLLICAIVSKRKQQMEQQQKYHHQVEFKKRPLRWKEYRAAITQSGYLELYDVCHCKKDTVKKYIKKKK